MSTQSDPPKSPRTPPREVHVTVIQQPPPPGSTARVDLRNSDFKDMFDLYRKQMEHEDILINHRVTFSNILQAPLVTVFLLIGQAGESLGGPDNVLSIRRVICLVGLALVAYALAGIMAARQAWKGLSLKAKQVIDQWKLWAGAHGYPLPIPDLPYGGGSEWAHQIGTWFGPFAFIVFGILWGLVLWLLKK